MRKKLLTGITCMMVAGSLLQGDIHDEKAQKWLGDIKLQAYKANYLLPLSYTEKKYKSFVPSTDYKHVEFEAQLSFRYMFSKNFFGFGGEYHIAYTHHAFWQLYTYSKPFRENIYNPELFVRYRIPDIAEIGLNRFQVGYEHMSNGQPNTEELTIDGESIGNISRGIDTVYLSLLFENGNFCTNLKAWYPVTSLDDNPDLMDYIGYSSIEVKYFNGRQILSALVKGNLAIHKGSIEASYAYPLSDAVNLYFKVFSGYTETLIDYKDHVNKYSFGFSFSQ